MYPILFIIYQLVIGLFPFFGCELLWILMHKLWMKYMLSVFLHMWLYPRSRLAGSYGNSMWLLGNCQTVFPVPALFDISTSNLWRFQFLSTLVIFCLLLLLLCWPFWWLRSGTALWLWFVFPAFRITYQKLIWSYHSLLKTF